MCESVCVCVCVCVLECVCVCLCLCVCVCVCVAIVFPLNISLSEYLVLFKSVSPCPFVQRVFYTRTVSRLENEWIYFLLDFVYCGQLFKYMMQMNGAPLLVLK